MGCALRPANKASHEAAACSEQLLLLAGGWLCVPCCGCVPSPLAVALPRGVRQASGDAKRCSTRAAAASSTGSGAVLLAATVMQHSWHSCSACTSQARRTCRQRARWG
jgi:hypothetical protein